VYGADHPNDCIGPSEVLFGARAHSEALFAGTRTRVKAMNLSASEIRVLGCLLEKQRTTPDQYPLSLNALRLACNQSTNRDPVVDYDDAVLRDALHRLERRGYTRYASGAGSRTPKYRHLLAEALPMAENEQAVMCVLMLRGPQTPGELKQRAERMHSFADLGAVHETLEQLIARELVGCLGRRPGQKEDRYAQLLADADADGPSGGDRSDLASTGGRSDVASTGGRSDLTSTADRSDLASIEDRSGPSDAGDRPGASLAGGQAAWAPSREEGHPAAVAPGGGAPVAALERRVARLEREIAELRAALGDPVASER
jgi:uncharacterized protein YceH (UPF0502 family)